MKERKLSIREIIVLLIAVILLISATACRASKADQTKENKKVKHRHNSKQFYAIL